MPHRISSLRAYNLAQLQVVEHAAAKDAPAHTVSWQARSSLDDLIAEEFVLTNGQSLLSPAAVLPGSEGERYVDAEGKRSFIFDHAALVSLAVSAHSLCNTLFGVLWLKAHYTTAGCIRL